MDAERVAAVAGQIEQIIQKRIADDKLTLPVMPVVAGKAMTMIRDPDFSLKKVALLIEQDPLLATRVVRLANSALYGAAGGAIKGVEMAVTRLGAQKVKMVLMECSARQIFESRDPRIALANKSIWEHSVAVAIVARDLRSLASEEGDNDGCYLCGLLHDVGKPVVATMLLEAERMARDRRASFLDSEAWIEAIGRVHRPVGVALAEKWKLPEEISKAIRDVNDYDPTNRSSAANYVRFANAVVKREGFFVGALDAEDVEAMIMIGRSVLGVSDELLARVTGGLAERVRAQQE